MNCTCKYIVSVFLLLMNGTAYSQSVVRDSISMEDFFSLIREYHPVARQISMMSAQADASLLVAKGSFDPKLYAAHEAKNFQGKQYFSLFEGGVKIATWPGVEVKTGIENNSGYLLNPENTTPANGLIYSQVSVPLLQGLFMDERRSVLRQAELAKKMTAYEMKLAMNELFFKAGKTYLDWLLITKNLKIYQQAYQLSKERFEATRRNVVQGDRAGIDTVEAAIQMQDRYAAFLQAQNDLKNIRLQLSLFIWNDKQENVIPSDKLMPVSPGQDINNNVFSSDKSGLPVPETDIHPLLKVYDFKIGQLQVDRKWKKEKMKPVLNAWYNPLTDLNRFSSYSLNQNKWGFTMGFPVLLRKERGELRSADIKILTQQLERDYKARDISVRLSSARNDMNTFSDMVTVQSDNLKNYERLWQSEKKMFELGESSLFMVNARESNYISAQIKLNDLNNKRLKSELELAYSAGTLADKLKL